MSESSTPDEFRSAARLSVSKRDDTIGIFSRERQFGAIGPAFVRWHLRGFLSPSLGLSPQQVLHSLDGLDREAEALLQTVKDGLSSLHSMQLLYEADVAERVFSTSKPTPAQLLAVHRVLHSAWFDRLRRDRGWRLGGPYGWRPDLSLLKQVEAMLENGDLALIAQFRLKAMRVLFEQAPLPVWSEPEQLFLRALLHYASSSHFDLIRKTLGTGYASTTRLENPWEWTAQTLTLGLCPCEPAEVWRILTRLGQIPANYDLAWQQSGLSHHGPEGEAAPQSGLVILPEGDEEAREVFAGEAVAIDAPSTVEVDDAISFDEKGWIQVHIADPASSLVPGSDLDRWVRERASSIYLPTGKIAMLPLEEVERHSLPVGKPVKALTFSARLDGGQLADFRVSPTILSRGVRRVSYEAACEDAELMAKLPLLQAHRSWRDAQGHLSLDIPRMSFHLNHDSMVMQRDRLSDSPAQLLVSESMILAGRIAAAWAQENRLLIPYRYHRGPTDPEMIRLADKLRHEGGQSSLFDRLRLILSLPSAALDLQPRPHWAMGLEAYTKATSPLRRYLDLVLHHQLHTTLPTGLRNPSHYRGYGSDLGWLSQVYRREMYIKQLQRASIRHWTLRHLAGREKHVILDCLVMDHNNLSMVSSLWIDQVAFILPARVIGLPNRIQRGTPLKVRLVSVDVVKGVLDLQRV